MAIRFGLLGTGHWALKAHGAAIAEHPEAELAGVWGRDPAKADIVAQRYGAPRFDTVDGLLAEVDAVAIALPPDVQAELAVRAARAGRHLLLDKPLALTTPDADRVVTAVDETGVSSIVFFTYRFFASVDRFLREAATGRWHGARVTLMSSIFQPGNPFGGSVWRREKGGLWDIGPHALSIVLPVLGPVVHTAAMVGPHDTTHLMLRHASGAVSTFALSLDVPPEATTHEFVFYGRDGIVSVPDGDSTATQALGVAISQLAAAVAAGTTSHPCDVRFGRDVVAVLADAQTVRV